MNQIDTCDICGLKVSGRRYVFYYGQFLRISDFVPGGTGGKNTWKEHYRVLGTSSGFLCRKCIFREFWKQWFSKEKFFEIPIVTPLMITAIISAVIFKVVEKFGLNSDFILFTIGFIFLSSIFLFKLIEYSIEFGNELAFKVKARNLPNIPDLVCITPNKYALMK